MIEDDGVLAACGGWSQRSTLFGADAAKRQPDLMLDPACDPARIRAFFVAPSHARQGLGRQLMETCIAVAQDRGFTRLIPTYDLINQVGVDIQYTHAAWLLKFEGLWRAQHGDHFYAMTTGFEYTLYQLFATT